MYKRILHRWGHKQFSISLIVPRKVLEFVCMMTSKNKISSCPCRRGYTYIALVRAGTYLDWKIMIRLFAKMILTRMETRQRGGVSDIQPIFLFWFGHWFAKIKIQASSKVLEVALILSPPPFPPHWSGSDARCSDGPTNDPRSDRGPIQDPKSQSHRPQMGTLKFTPRQLRLRLQRF